MSNYYSSLKNPPPHAMHTFPPSVFLRLFALSLFFNFAYSNGFKNVVTLAQFGTDANKYNFAERRFLLYDVNPGEGFNLRRDVYTRVANAVRQLRERGLDFVLVLPPWGNIWHWRRKKRTKIRWSELFDMDSLANFVPVMEFDEFVDVHGDFVETVLYLQNYAEGWPENGEYVLKYDLRPCIEADKYYIKRGHKWHGHFFDYAERFHAEDMKCLSIQGQSSTLATAVTNLSPKGRSLMVDRAEVILHDQFGDFFFWQARKSMRYAKRLRSLGDAFRAVQFGNASEYLGAHLRRADFVWAHRMEIPSVEGAAVQVGEIASKLGVRDVFLSTDATASEVETFAHRLAEQNIRTVTFSDVGEDEDLSEAAISIVDQWICANSRFFIGTHLSTFSFRIHEDREILGLDPETTFNRFCPDGVLDCEQPAKWTIGME
uniref:GDP-fucose protein O-fucosyltransferase 2 n=1 Tax=Globodera rostochiensis TaxID=31243 RepID=A0A914HCH2_GLORO